jgi:Kef-type K+ transport system membrane component KefB
MESLLIIGIILFTGFVLGEIVSKIKLPKITGYILAGILLNPGLFHIIPSSFNEHTDVITNIALSFITFSVGGTLLYKKIKKLGKEIISITFFEAEFSFLAVFLGFLSITPFFLNIANATWFVVFIPISLLLAALASPTDPSSTLAITHEYKAKGEVSQTIMGVAAFDDALGIVNYSLAITIGGILIINKTFDVFSSVFDPLFVIFGAILLGIVFGFIFNSITWLVKRETEGMFIVIIVCFLLLCFGVAKIIGVDELLATMSMGAIVVNFNRLREKIFKILERYTEELIFVLFFTISGMHLNFSVLSTSYILILFFVIFRTVGKVSGAKFGAHLAKSPVKVKKYIAGGLIPQGGIVIGLALLIKQNNTFNQIADVIISVIIGATIIHELIGPIIAKISLKKAGEIKG